MNRIANMNLHYHRYPLDYFLDSTVRLGLDAVELWGGAPHLFLPDLGHADLRQVLGGLRQRGLELVCLTPEQCIYPVNLSAKDEACRRRSLDYFRRAIGAANTLECSRLLVTAGYGFFNEPREEAWERGRASLAELAEEAREAGVTLLLEPLSPLGSNLVTDLASLQRMHREVDSPALKILLDTVPMMLAGDTLEAYGEAFGEELVHIHFLDGDGKTSAHLAWGEGVYPLDAFRESLQRIGYRGALSLELIGPQYNRDPEKASRDSLIYLGFSHP
ncbi:protein FrlC [Paenibacillus mucilaginosus]|uniref:TIM barrel protein n=1 Tax=Paenibacillus mucilaginosus TaxID=61624 RepID=UPI003D252582